MLDIFLGKRMFYLGITLGKIGLLQDVRPQRCDLEEES
jgi:hypothetical protein